MRIYRFVWLVVTALVAACAAVYDGASGGWLRLALLGPSAGLFGALLGFAFAEDRPDRWRWAVRGLLLTAAGAMVADALIATWGGIGVLVGLLLLVGSPTLVGIGRRQFLAWATRRTSGPPQDLSTRDLLRRWDWTTAEVLRVGTAVDRRLVLVEERSTLLDEIERRDPLRFDDWVATAVPGRAPSTRSGGGERPWRHGW